MSITDIKNDSELADVAKLFFGDGFGNISLDGDGVDFNVTVGDKKYSFNYSDDVYSAVKCDNRLKRLAKIALYDALSAHTGKKMPWGALTGVRPSKLFYELIKQGNSHTRATELMSELYRVEEARACILRRIEYSQRGKLDFPSNYYNLYVHIPYCTTRCSYCSFVSAPIAKNIKQASDYIDLLCDEIKRSVDFIRSRGGKILSAYIGGGTPTALCAERLDKLLGAIDDFGTEYTCEAGRPDTIDEEKIAVLKAHGVTRVCVNPQTLIDATLEEIGRKHTAADFYRAYDIVRSAGFDINCDLIAGLGSETAEQFKISFEGIKTLAPENITVHSLSRKNGSSIRYTDGENSAAADMIEYAFSALGPYRPYYLYRQKRQTCNLENVGFSLPGKECVNNITTMEETVSVMACGAGAISKLVGGGKIARVPNMRDVPLYISRYTERLDYKLGQFALFEQNTVQND